MMSSMAKWRQKSQKRQDVAFYQLFSGIFTSLKLVIIIVIRKNKHKEKETSMRAII